MPRFAVQLIAVIALAGLPAVTSGSPGNDQRAASSGQRQRTTYAAVTAVGVSHDKKGPAVEIVSTRPVIPEIQLLQGPPRLVIDLPRTRMAVRQKRFNVQAFQISTIRVDQFQQNPPVTRVVVDLLSPLAYSWDAVGNRLMVRLKPITNTRAPRSSPPVQPSVVGFSKGQPVFMPQALGQNSSIAIPADRLAPGSSITAGESTSLLRLARGGEIRVCPGTTLLIASSPNGRDLMVGMSTGTLETHYPLADSADSIVTPDFRILLSGPGEFHFAVSTDVRGNTCVRGLPGNTASAVISELMGDRTFQVKPADQLFFHSGQLDQVDTSATLGCGCSHRPDEVILASTKAEPLLTEDNLPLADEPSPQEAKERPPGQPSSTFVPGNSSRPPAQVTVSVMGSETAPLPPSRPGEVHVSVEAPFVFQATDADSTPARQAKSLPLLSADRQPALQTVVQAPPTLATQPTNMGGLPKPGHSRFLGKIKGFLATVFR